MAKKHFPKITSYLPHILAFLFLAAFSVFAWSEPSQSPPQNNAPAPINVSSVDQSKQGALGIGGGAGQALQWLKNVGGSLLIQNQAGNTSLTVGQDNSAKIGGDLLDSAGNTVYNNSTKKIERARLPFEQGDITSDVDTNTWDGGYFDVANLAPGNVKKGISFGRAQVGTVEPLLMGDLGAVGLLTWQWQTGWLPGSGVPCNSDFNPCVQNQWSTVWKSRVIDPNWIVKHDPRGLLNYQVTSTKNCWTGGCSWAGCFPCKNNPLPQGYTTTCASGWLKQFSSIQTVASYGAGTSNPCSNGNGCDAAQCTWGYLPPPPPPCPPYCVGGGDE